MADFVLRAGACGREDADTIPRKRSKAVAEAIDGARITLLAAENRSRLKKSSCRSDITAATMRSVGPRRHYLRGDAMACAAFRSTRFRLEMGRL
jgi:hypothetical protein